MDHSAPSGTWLPLSFAQRSRWFAWRLDPAQRGWHNNGFSARVDGRLDAAALAAALTRLVARHPMLRTRFRERDGEPEQCVAEFVQVAVDEVHVEARDLAGLPARVRAGFAQIFDSAQPQRLRAILYHGPDGVVLSIAFDHLAVDGWSYWRLLDELGRLLADPLAADGTAAMPEYGDYIAWQRDWLAGARADAHWRYWRDRLDGAPPLQLPSDRARGGRGVAPRRSVTVMLGDDEAQALRALGRGQGASLFATLLAGYCILLRRHAGQDDIVVGTPLPGRGRAWADVVGDFVNPVALRVRMAPDANTADVLRSARGAVFGAMKHADYPFPALVERLRPGRGADGHPLFQTVFTYQDARSGRGLARLFHADGEGASVPWGGSALAPFPAHQTGIGAHLPLALEAIELEAGIRCDLHYDPELYDEASVRRMGGHFRRLLAGMAAAPGQAVDTLALLDDDERALVLGGFHGPRRDFGDTGLIHRLVEAWSAAAPERVALVADGAAIGYGALNRQANAIAHRLLALGVRPDDRVALCARRGIGMVAGMLGILKAGAAYVPLDPDYPAERLAFVLDDCRPVALLAQPDLLARLPATAAPTLTLDGADAPAAPDHDPVVAGLRSSHLAYLIYTSGSTGRPKGVMVEHRNVTRLLTATAPRFSFGADDVWSLFHSFAFDFSVWELWTPLAAGARVVIVPAACARAPDDFYALLCREGVTVLNQTPGAFRELIAAQARSAARHRLRWIVFGGEALEPRMLAPWVERNDPAVTRLVNMYGITETTVHVSHRDIGRADLADAASAIGTPLPDLTLRILDARMEPVPIGVAGEIHVGGAGLARGYFNLPALSAERFVPDPHDPGPAARLYRSGDLARWRADGDIEYLGRNDFQVKIRGFRIEPGEIAARLAQCAGVRDAVVLAQADADGGARLVAWVIAAEDAQLSGAALRDELAAALPAHMVPAAIVTLDAFPLTPNGKLDRAALPAPDHAALARAAYTAPEGEDEIAMARLWQDLLGLAKVGRDDGFFDIGGHSLLATRLIARIRAAFDADVALGDLFAQSTLAQVAQLARAAANAAVSAAAPILPQPRDVRAAVSLGQQRLWFLDQVDPMAGAAYRMPAAWRLRGRLDKAALRAALDAIVARHEVLRTSFPAIDGVPVQAVAPAAPFALDEHDLGYLAASAVDAAVDAFCAAETARAFDLASGPLFRGALLALDDDTHVLVLVQHHAVSDGWSVRLLFAELAALYEALRTGRPDPLAPPRLQYADFAQWQRGLLGGARLNAQAAYWHGQLAGAPVLLQLPLDRPRPARQTHAGGHCTAVLAPALARALEALGRRHGATPFMVHAAAWGVLMARLAGQDDVVIGTPSANRRHAEWEPLIGFFVNTLALRVRLDGAPTLAQLLAQVKATALAAQANQDLPFEQVVDAVNPPRSLAHAPLFQVMLAMDDGAEAAELALAGLAVERLAPARRSAQFDLSLTLRTRGGALHAELDYASDLFDEATARRFLRHWECLLAGMAAAPTDADLAVSRLPLLDAGDRATLARFNDTAMPWPRERLLHQAFEAQAAAHPARTALTWHAGTLGYGALNARAKRIAHRLAALGVRPDDRVALCAERTPDMVAAILGILKAGAAYVPLDPAYPPERLAYMLADCAPAALLCQAATAARVDAGAVPRIVLDADGALDAASDTASDTGSESASESDPAPAGLRPDHLAYLIYTSGSTGQPKGVMVEHRNAVAFIAWAQATFTPAQLDLTLFSTSINFDLAVFELFLPLSSGRPLALVQNVLCSNDELRGVSLINTVPSAIDVLLKAGWVPPTASVVNLAGEPLRRRLVERLFADTRVDTVGNLYGPSETTTYSTYVLMPRAGGLQPHIGRPVGNTQVHILDAHRMPVPVGVVGELYIGGAGVARGYLNRPALSAERFLPDPFSAEPDARMYRTGDLGRWRADGNIVYVGRNDFQVKIRGFRIELGEIEAKLGACAGIQEAVVVAHADGQGELRLAAYALAQPGAQPDPAGLRAALAAQLPGYMVPASLIVLDAWPLTPNGKLDRAALPAPDAPRGAQGADAADAAPRAGTEAALAALWQALLGVARVGRDDNFFDIGGHSLLAVQLVARMREALGLDVALADVFAHPVLAALAAHVSTAAPRALAPIPVLGDADAYALSDLQSRLWLAQRLDPQGNAYNMPAVLALPAPVRAGALARVLAVLAARHPALRTVFALRDGVPVQAILPAVAVPLDEALAADADALAAMAARHARTVFDLERGPLFAARLVHAWDGRTLLLWNMHHLVGDGASLAILRREMLALLAGGGVLPPPPRVRHVDVAAWHAAMLHDGGNQDGAAQRAFWHARLDGAPTLELPCDYPAAARIGSAGAACRLVLDPDQAGRLRALAARHHGTLFMVLASGFALLLGRMAGQDDVCIGTPAGGRTHPDMQDLVGCFINTVVLRHRILPGDTVAALLRAVRGALLDALAHQDTPFEHLLEELGLARAAVVPAFLNLVPVDAGDEAAAPKAGPHRVLAQDVKFDLNLYVGERGDALVFDCHYRSACFEAATVEYVLRAYLDLLLAMADGDERTCASFELFTLAPRASLPDADADADAGADADAAASIPARFARQVALHGERVAVCTPQATLSYRELDAASGALARMLVAHAGAGAGRVALLFEHGAPMIVGLLAALKAGKTYVPLDPAYPEARLAYMLDNAQAGMLLAHGATADLAARLAQAGGIAVVDVDRAGPSAHQPDAAALPAAIAPDTPAYILYTSGSTGQPKGVVQSHRNALYFCRRYSANLRIGAGDRLLLLASYSFDAAVMDIFGALLNGAALYPVDPRRTERPALLAWMAGQAVSVYHSTPTLFRHLFGADMRAHAALRFVVLGGEVVTAADVARFQAACGPGTVLVNGYGPTESTLALQHFIGHADALPASGVPAGHPIAGTRIALGAPGMRPHGFQRGEIVIESAHVALGYWNNPAQTARAFGASAAGRWYRSGDVGRYRIDGSLVVEGRVDHQLKIRGFRVEPGEVEAALKACSGVRDALVVARASAGGPARLVAYVVADDAGLSVPALRAQLLARLPEYMVPGAWVTLDRFPQTPSGKLDRSALPAPDDGAAATRDHEASRGAAEVALAAQWVALLGRQRVGRYDHFFELGGDSLLAVTLAERLRLDGWRVAVREVFTRPVLADLAATMVAADAKADAKANDTDAGGVPPDTTRLTPDQVPLADLDQDALDRLAGRIDGGLANIQDVYRLAPLQEGILFHHRLQAEGDAYLLHIVLDFADRGRLDAFLGALQQVIDRHDILRSCVQWDALAHPVQVVCRRAPLPLREIELPPGDALAALVSATDPRVVRLDVRHAPLLNATVGRDGEGRWLLALLAHHLVCDHVTLELVMEEVHALLAGTAAALPKALPYRRFIAGLADDDQAAHEAYFRARLADVGVPTAPFDVLEVHADAGAVTDTRFALTGELAARLRAAARRHQVGPAALCHLAWAAVLARFCGRDDVVFGTVLLGRMHGLAQGQRMVGMFINALPLRVRLAGDVAGALHAVHADLAELLQHEQAPLPLALRSSGVAAPLPLFTTLFNYRHSAAGRSLADAGWDGMRVLHAHERTNYPVTVSVDDVRDGFALRVTAVEGVDGAMLAQGMEGALAGLVHALELDAAAPLVQLDILDEAGRTRLAAALETMRLRRAAAASCVDADAALAGLALHGPAEQALAAAWRDLLGLEQIDRRDHFFALGGDSMATVAMVERLRLDGWSVAVREVFARPVLADLAATMVAADAKADAKANDTDDGGVPPAATRLTPDQVPLADLDQDALDRLAGRIDGGLANIQDVYRLAPLQEGILFHHRLQAEGDAYLLHIVLDFADRGRLDAFLGALQQVIDRHDILRSCVQWDGLAHPVQVVCRQAPLPVREIVLPPSEALATLVAATDPQAVRLDVRHAPLLNATVGRDGEGRWLLALLAHHLVCDHVTLELVMEEVHALLAGTAAALPKALPYRRFIAGLAHDDQAAHEAYFRARLADVDVPTAPFDVLEVHADAAAVTETRIALGDVLAARVRATAKQQQVGPAALCHLAWAAVLARFCGRDDVVFGTVLLGRMGGLAQGQRMVGMFINALPLRVRLAGDVAGALHAVHADLAELLEHEQAPLPLALRSSGVAAPLPLFTTMFNYRHSAAGRRLAGADWNGMRVLHARERSNYPVTVSVDDFRDGFALRVTAVDGVDGALLAQGLEGALAALVHALELDAAAPLAQIEILDEDGRTRLAAALDEIRLRGASAAESTAVDPAPAYETPQGRAEQALAAAWRDLLGLDRIGRRDHFFALGGDSMATVTLVERLRLEGWTVAVREVFARPVLADLAATMVAADAKADAKANDTDAGGVPPAATRLTPDQVPLADLDQDALDRLAGRIDGGLANIQDVYRLAPLQEGILFHHRLQAEGDAYLLHIVLDFADRGRLDAFLGALQQVIDRHDILRSCVQWDGLAHPVQVVCRQAPLPVREIVLPPGDALAALVSATDPHAVRLDVRHAPLLNATVCRDGEGRWLLALLAHHLVCDHVTLELVMEEVHALLAGGAASLPKALPYRRFIAGLADDDQAAHEAYFRARLADVDVPTAPFDVLEVRADAAAVTETRIALGDVLAARVRATAKQQQVGPAALCHLAWAAVLARFCGQDDVVFGTVLLGRMGGLVQGQRMVGMFINALPLRVRLAGDVAEALHAVHADLAELLEHEQAPLPLALRSSGVAAPLPLFTTMFNYRHSAAGRRLAGAGWDGMRVLHARERSNYPVTVSVDDFRDGFELRVLAVDGIDGGQLAHALESALAALAQALDAPVPAPMADLDIVDAAWRARLVDAVNDTRCEYEDDALMHALFERRAAARPLAPALCTGTETVSYGELNRRANLVARRLGQMGVGPGTRVALCAARGAGMVAGLLGILKAGGAYVPLDPAHPPARMDYMLADSAPAVVLCGAALRARFAARQPLLVLEEAIDDSPDPGNPCPRALGLDAGSLAYLIYTSGSTGQPKGVMIQHRPAVNLIAWVNRRFAVDGDDKLLFTTSVCFDLSVYDIFGTLAAGACVRIAREDELADPNRLLAILAEEGITFWDSAPAVFAQLRPALAQRDAVASSLRLAFFSGDWIALDLPDVVRRAFPRCQVVSLGGATEATIWSNYYPVDAVAPHWTSIPYGKPIANARYYVLDRYLRPCPVGVAGDLYIGGACLSAGYWNKPELSAERFVPDPFAAPGARMYRSGDRARYWQDGNLEFLGRLDGQVKLRGYRVELSEIEACLAALDGVRDAVVLARPDGAGGKRLVAYVAGDLAQAPASLRAALEAVLPAYMVPGAYVHLARLPLTANGKVDRAALPEPDDAAVAARSYEAPQGAAEEALAEQWRALLALERIGRHDHFFELGGHSLMVVALVERLRRLGYAAEVLEVFERPVLSDLAALLAAARPANADTGIGIDGDADDAAPDWRAGLSPDALAWLDGDLPGGLDNVEDAYPLAPLQDAMLVHHLMHQDGGGDAYLMRVVLETDSADRAGALLAALQAVVARQPVLRTTLRWQRLDAPLQLVLRRAALDVRWLAPCADPDAALEAASDPRTTRLALDAAPLLRAIAVRRDDGRCRIALLYHHAVCDHVTLEILMEQVGLLMRDPAAVLPPSRAYRHFVRRWRAQPAAAQRAYFTRELGDVTTPTAPFGLHDTGGAGTRVTETYRAVPAALADRIVRCAARQGASPAVLFHVAWARVLARLARREDVVFGTVLSGRMQGDAGADRALGVFINALPLRVRLGGHDAAALVAATRAALLALIPHEQAPYALAQQCSGIPASLPLFTALLNYRHGARGGAALEGIRTVDGYSRTNFPLSLDVDEYRGGFGIGIECVAPLRPERVAELVLAALSALVGALDAPDAAAPFVGLPLLSTPMRRDILDAWDALQPATDRQDAAWRPDARWCAGLAALGERPAVEDETGTWTYARLGAWVADLAAALARAGIDAGTPVRIDLPHGRRKTGCALALLARGCMPEGDEDAAPAALAIVDEEGGDGELLCDGLRLRRASTIPTAAAPTAKRTVTPAALAQAAGWLAQACALAPEQRIGVAAGLPPLRCLRDACAVLHAGATLVCAPAAIAPQALCGWLERSGLALFSGSAAHLRALLRSRPAAARLPALRGLLIGGGALLARDVARWRALMPDAPIVHVAGRAASACTDLCWRDDGLPLETVYAPLGRPVPGRRILLCGDDGEPVYPDEAGILYLRMADAADGMLRVGPGLVVCDASLLVMPAADDTDNDTTTQRGERT